MYNRRYEKVFLMLRQETAGYALGKRPPWGSCVMELKNGRGRLHLTILGLKPLQYEVYVMAGEKSIFCGAVIPEKKEGRCELKWEFDPDAVAEGRKAEDLHTVIVLAEGLSAPLTAYFREKRDWREDFRPKEKEQPEQTESILQAAETVVPIPQEKQEEKTVVKGVEEETGYHGSFQGLLKKFRQELEELEETGILSHEETEQIRNMGATDAVSREKTEMPTETAEGERFSFEDGTAWKRITLEDMLLLSQIPLKWRKEFFFLLSYRKYHHLILREGEAGVWLGVPGRFDPQDAADAHAFGFHEFRNTDGDWGYWMTFLKRNS